MDNHVHASSTQEQEHLTPLQSKVKSAINKATSANGCLPSTMESSDQAGLSMGHSLFFWQEPSFCLVLVRSD